MTKLHKIIATTALVSTAAVGLSQVADADTYTVKSGDTLWDIAVNNGTSVEQLMKDNNLTSDLIFPGDKLNYEVTAGNVAVAKEEGYYTVALGDTLGKLSTRFGLSVDKLVELNKIVDSHMIYVGQVLRVTDEVAAPVSTDVKSEENPQVTLTKAPAKEEVKETPKVEVVPQVAKVEEKPVVQHTVAKVETPKVEVAAPANKAAAIYQAALAQLGVAQDCTMLVTNALKAVGINFHDWPAGYMSLGTVVSASEAVPGDLVYYANGGMGAAHIAVYAGGGQAVHGGWNGNQTVVNTAYLGSGPVFIRVK